MTRRLRIRTQRGFTMVEMMVALAISGIIIASAVALLYYTVTAAGQNEAKTLAYQEVRYIGFWISEDTQQAQTITLENTTVGSTTVVGFPLTLGWLDTDTQVQTWIKYTTGPGTSSGRWQLMRESGEDRSLLGGGNVSLGQTIVGQNLDPAQTYCQKQTYTCDQFACVNSLTLQVTANVDGNVATNRYQIHPRALSLWYP